jgi:hypothetical protein
MHHAADALSKQQLPLCLHLQPTANALPHCSALRHVTIIISS